MKQKAISMLRTSSIYVVVAAALTACGGGGGADNNAPAAVAPSAAVALDAGNYSAASTEAASSALFLLYTPSLAVGVESSDTYQGVRFGLAQVPSLGSWFAGGPVAAGVVQSLTQNCAVNGTISGVVADADNNGVLSAGDSISLTATNCRPDVNTVIDGGIAFSVGALSGDLSSNLYDASLNLTFRNLKVSTAAGSVSANGDLVLSASANGAYVRSQSVTANSLTASATYGSASYSRTLTNFNASINMTPNLPVSTYKTTSSVSGTVSSSALNNQSVTIATDVPFARLSTDAYPSTGRASLTGSTAAKVRLTAQSATSVNLELDSNGDGIYETSSVKNWADLR